MVVGVLKLSLILPDNHSLKGKRGVIRSIQSKVSHRFNVSTTECDHQDLWQSTVLGFSVVGTSQQVVDATLGKIVDYIDGMNLAQIGQAEVEFVYC